MKSTGVGQNRQYPSTYAPNGAPSSHHQDRMPIGSQQRHNYGRPPRTTSDGQQHHRQQQQKDANGYDTNTGGNSAGFGSNNSYRPNRGSNIHLQSGQRGQYLTNAPSGQDGRPNNNSYRTASASYQPRQIQKSADLESEYTRLNRQDEITHYVEDPTNILSATDMATAAAEQIASNKQDLPVLTLKNSLSKISFCDRECFNVNDNPTKEAILKYIETKYKGLNIIDNQYVLMKPHMLKNITYHEHILTTFTNGNPYLLFLTRIDNVPCSIFIDRKVKDGYCYPKIHCVQYKFAAELFDAETIFTGELVRDVNRNFQYLISDLLVHNGEYIKHRNILSRFQTLHSILDQQYTPDPATEICPIYCKRLFQYADIKFLLQEFLPVLSYTCKGIVFHTLNNQFSDYAWVMPREKQIEVPRRHELDAEFYRRFPEFAQYRSADTNQMSHLTASDDHPTNSTNPDQQQPSTTTFVQSQQGPGNRRQQFVSADALGSDPQKAMLGNSSYYIRLQDPVVLLAMQTDIPDIVNLYTQDNLADKLGYAFIPNLRVSQMLHQGFKSLTTGQMTIPVSVAYHRIFNRWVPFEIASATLLVDTTATLETKKQTNKLADLVTTSAAENITAIGLVN
jgi:hypothetical protein